MLLRFPVTLFAAAALLIDPSSKGQSTRFHDAPEAAARSKDPFAAQQQAVDTGAQLYANHRAACHGLKAQGTSNVPALWCSVNGRDVLGDNLVPDAIPDRISG